MMKICLIPLAKSVQFSAKIFLRTHQREEDNHKFVNTGSLVAIKHKRGNRRTLRRRDRGHSHLDSSQELDQISSHSARLLTKNLYLHAHKMLLAQLLLPTEYAQYREFTNQTIENKKYVDFVDNFIFSEKTYFHLDGFINRHNCPIWEDFRIIIEKKSFPNMSHLVYIVF